MRSDNQPTPVQLPVPEVFLDLWPDGHELLMELAVSNRLYQNVLGARGVAS